MALKTGAEYRHANKKRVQRHREAMKAKGYRAKTVFLSNKFQGELKRVCTEQGLPQHEAFDYILEGFLNRNDNTNISVNDSPCVIPTSVLESIPESCRTDDVFQVVANALDFHSNVVLIDAITYVFVSMNINTPGQFANMLPHVLIDGLYVDRNLKEITTSVSVNDSGDDAVSKKVNPPLEFEDETKSTNGSVSKKKVRKIRVSEDAPPKPEVGKMAELNLSQEMEVIDSGLQEPDDSILVGADEMTVGDPEVYKALDKSPHLDPEEAKQKVTENDLDLFTGDPIPRPILPDCHGKKLTVEDRDCYILRTEEMFPGKGKNKQRAEALNKAGITTARGKQWTAKSVTDNLHHAKRRAEKK